MEISEVKDYIEHNYSKMQLCSQKEMLMTRIEKILDSCGIMYRIFGREKSKNSVLCKIDRKYEKYISEDCKLQDIIGIRIVLYFKDDIDVCVDMINGCFEELNHECDKVDSKTFMPVRINYVYKIPDDINMISTECSEKCLIDNSFEVQFRTVFSEGWHEVEHDVRYKHQEDWENENEMARDFNAILAVLEMCDNNIIGICDNLAYNKYKSQDIEAMLRNRFRLRFQNMALSKDLKRIVINDYERIGKQLFRFRRELLIYLFMKCNVDCSFDNAIYIINSIKIKNVEIDKLCPESIANICADEINSTTIEKARPYNSIVAMKHNM